MGVARTKEGDTEEKTMTTMVTRRGTDKGGGYGGEGDDDNGDN